MRGLAAVAAVVALGGHAHGQSLVVSPEPDAIAITVYPEFANVGLAMVTETRRVDLPGGAVRLEFRGVADGMLPQTVSIDGLPDPLQEQNYDYQLLTPRALMQASEGRQVSLVRTNPVTGEVTQDVARIVSAANGTVLDIEGRLEALKCSDMPQRLVFDDLPPGFVAEPTLSTNLTGATAGPAVLSVSYLVTGVSWRTNYVASVGPDRAHLNLTSWVVLENDSDTSFADAPVQIVAGELQRVEPDLPRRIPPPPPPRPPSSLNPALLPAFFENYQNGCWQTNPGRFRRPLSNEMAPPVRDPRLDRIGGAAEDQALPVQVIGRDELLASNLGDYKIYQLPEPTTLAAHQTKQLFMFERPDVEFDLVYRIFAPPPGTGTTAAWPVMSLTNEMADGLGLPMPRGDVTVLMDTQDGPLLAGSSQMGDTPVGSPIEWRLGRENRLQAQKFSLSRRERPFGRGVWITERFEVRLTNAFSTPAVVQLREGSMFSDTGVSAESHTHEMVAGQPQWSLEVPANDEVRLRYSYSWYEPEF